VGEFGTIKWNKKFLLKNRGIKTDNQDGSLGIFLLCPKTSCPAWRCAKLGSSETNADAKWLAVRLLLAD
jgi:hypothetical protein